MHHFYHGPYPLLRQLRGLLFRVLPRAWIAKRGRSLAPLLRQLLPRHLQEPVARPGAEAEAGAVCRPLHDFHVGRAHP